MGAISLLIRREIYTRLTDPELGFNQIIAQMVERPDYKAEKVRPFTIQFEKDPSPNFFFGEFSLDDLLDTTGIQFDPCVLTLFCVSENNQVGELKQKYLMFSGTVDAAIDAWVSWPMPMATRAMEAQCDMIGEALITVVNRYSDITQKWSPEIGYSGNITITASPIGKGSEHWLRKISARMTFHVHQQAGYIPAGAVLTTQGGTINA